MYFKQIRSATIMIEYAGKKILVDPWLSEKGAYPPIPVSGNQELRNPLVDLPISLDEILKVDAVIVTHTHFDHFDEVAKQVIPKEMKMFVQDEVDTDELKAAGFTNLEILQYDGIKFADISLFKTSCTHGKDEVTEEYYAKMGCRTMNDACGVVLKNHGEKTLYIAGDTLWFEGVEEAINKYKPDVITLNTARAEFPQGHPIIMGTEDIYEVYKAAPQADIIASHMGAVSHATLTREDIKEFLTKHNITNVWVPNDGESRTF